MQRIGSFLLATGTLIVLCVVLLWLTAPLIESPLSSQSAVSDLRYISQSAPALSPYMPSEVIAAGEELVDKLPLNASSAPVSATEPLDELPGSSNWRIISYSEARTVGAHDRASSKPSLQLSIPALGIDAPVIPVSLEKQQDENRRPVQRWTVPNHYAAGWHDSSSLPGQSGNTVLNGHNNIHGAVFSNLVELTLGEQIVLYDGEREYTYQVIHREFLREQGESLRTRLRNARWIAPSEDTRLTIVTCWPNTSNSHRLVVIAQPLTVESGF